MSKPFLAKYSGRCSECADVIEAGDSLVSDDAGGYQHVECKPKASPLRLARPACPTCYMELPVSGVCGSC